MGRLDYEPPLAEFLQLFEEPDGLRDLCVAIPERTQPVAED
jgi:hypothetical protein